MKKTIACMIIMLLILSLVFAATGCQPKKEGSKKALSICIQGTANVSGIDFSDPAISSTVTEVVSSFGYVSVINMDGEPDVVLRKSFDIDERYKSASDERLEADARSNAASLITALKSIKANDAEVDCLGALKLAARSLSTLEGYDEKTIFVASSGLSTVLPLDFRNNLLSADDVDSIVDMLSEREEIPQLNDITVVWQVLDVADPQPVLNSKQRNSVIKLWESIVNRGGGTFILKESIPIPATGSDLPPVSVVDIPSDTPISFDRAVATQQDDLLEEPISFTEERIGFLPNQAVFKDEDNVREVLRPIADYLIQNTDVKLLLAGCTAGDTQTEWDLELSTMRAAAVKDVLVELGIDEVRLIIVGCGCEDPWHINGVGVSGPLAVQNRKVVLLLAESEMAVELINRFN